MKRTRRIVGAAIMAATTGLLAAATAGAQGCDESLTPKAHFMSGKLYFSQKVFDKAEGEFACAASKDSADAEFRAYWATAMCELARARLDAATVVTDQAERGRAIQGISPLLEKAGREFDNALAMDPKKQSDFVADNRLHYWVDLYQLGDNLLKSKRYQDALEIFRLATALDPKEPGGHFQVAYAHAQLGEVKKAVLMAGDVRGMAQARIEEMGDCTQFKSAKKKSECRKRIANMETIIKNVDSFTRSKNADLGNEAYERGTAEKDGAARRAAFDEAITFYGAALTQDPKLEGVRFNLGNAWFEKARSFDDSGDKANARTAYEKGAEVFMVLADNDSADADTRRDALYNAASAYYSAEVWDKASPLFVRYIDLNPKEPQPYRLNATCLNEGGRRLEAVSYFMMANALSNQAEVTPVDQSVNTARNLYSMGDMGKALGDGGNPEDVRTFIDKDMEGREITTWIWWSKGRAQHFIKGEAAGRIDFKPVLAN